MYGDLAAKLVSDAKRSQQLATLPAYQQELVRSICREVQHLDEEASAQLESAGGNDIRQQNEAAACAVLVQYLCMRRNKRCLLAYHRARMERLEQACWSAVGWEHTGGGGLSAAEQEYARRYTELVAGCAGRWTEIDLAGPLLPPRELFVDVRVLRDAGEIQTEYGAVVLTRNSQFYARHADVERLVQQGFLARVP